VTSTLVGLNSTSTSASLGSWEDSSRSRGVEGEGAAASEEIERESPLSRSSGEAEDRWGGIVSSTWKTQSRRRKRELAGLTVVFLFLLFLLVTRASFLLLLAPILFLLFVAPTRTSTPTPTIRTLAIHRVPLIFSLPLQPNSNQILPSAIQQPTTPLQHRVQMLLSQPLPFTLLLLLQLSSNSLSKQTRKTNTRVSCHILRPLFSPTKLRRFSRFDSRSQPASTSL